MRFCPWYPLADADRHAPTTAGVFQIRVAEGLLDYPGGKSAMIHYQAAGDLRAAIAGFRAGHPGRAWLCRHTVDMTADEVDAAANLHARLLRDFTARFGVGPRLPR